MLADGSAVDKHFGFLEHAIKFERDALARNGLGVQFKVLAIPAVADIKVIGEKVGRAERVRQANRLPRAVFKHRRLSAGEIALLILPQRVDDGALPRVWRRVGGASEPGADNEMKNNHRPDGEEYPVSRHK